MELVFEPDLETGEEAAALVKELLLILQRLGTCSCKMEGKQVAVMWIRLTRSDMDSHRTNSVLCGVGFFLRSLYVLG